MARGALTEGEIEELKQVIAEIEIEDASTGEGGEVSVAFAYLEGIAAHDDQVGVGAFLDDPQRTLPVLDLHPAGVLFRVRNESDADATMILV